MKFSFGGDFFAHHIDPPNPLEPQAHTHTVQVTLADVLFGLGTGFSDGIRFFPAPMTQNSWHRNSCSTRKQDSASNFMRRDFGVRPGTRSTKCQALFISAISLGRSGVPSVCSHHAALTPANLLAQGFAPISRQTLNICLRHMHIQPRRKQDRWLIDFGRHDPPGLT